MQIRHNKSESLGHTVDFDHEAPFYEPATRWCDQFERLDIRDKLVKRKGHKAPIFAPSVIEYVYNGLCFRFELFEIEGSDIDPFAPLRPRNYAPRCRPVLL